MFDCWWGIGNTRCSGGEGRTREEQEDGGGIAVVEGIDGGGEKKVVKPMAGMTYLRNQVYVGRRSIVPVHSRAGLPPVIAAAAFCRSYLSLRLPANTLRTCTTNPHEFLSRIDMLLLILFVDKNEIKTNDCDIFCENNDRKICLTIKVRK